MATQAQIDALLAAVENSKGALTRVDEERSKLKGYKEVRDNYVALIAVQKDIANQAVVDSEAALRALADAIDVVYP